MLKIDLHTHTIHSGHAYATFYEMLEQASKNGMKMIAVTEHGPSMHGAISKFHFGMGTRAPKDYKGVKVLWGCEANIIDTKGNIDLDKDAIETLDVLLATVHTGTEYKDKGKKANTEAIIKCFKKNHIHIFSHPEALWYDYDFEKVCEAACKNNVLLELNMASLRRLKRKNDKHSLNMLKKMVQIAKKHNKKIILNSDAHFLHEVGDDKILKEYWNELGLSYDIIINNYPKELMKILKK